MIDFSTLLANGIAALAGPSAIFFALLAIGLNVHFGYTGLLNFGQIGFALVGGYGMGRCDCVRTTWRSSRSRPRRSCG